MYNALIFVFTAFNTGATAMIARYYGEKNTEGMSRVAGQAILINLILGVTITTASAVFGRAILTGAFEMAADVARVSLQYFYIVLISQVFMFFSFSSAAILRGAGDTMTPMLVNGGANILNIIGNYLLITGLGPFPEMGVAGAAVSTVGARVLAALVFAYIILVRHNQFKIRLIHVKLSRTVFSKLFQLSYPGGIEQLMMNGSFLIMSSIVSKLNTLSEAAFRICLQIESISFMPAIGLGVATATLVGKALGEKRPRQSHLHSLDGQCHRGHMGSRGMPGLYIRRGAHRTPLYTEQFGGTRGDPRHDLHRHQPAYLEFPCHTERGAAGRRRHHDGDDRIRRQDMGVFYAGGVGAGEHPRSRHRGLLAGGRLLPAGGLGRAGGAVSAEKMDPHQCPCGSGSRGSVGAASITSTGTGPGCPPRNALLHTLRSTADTYQK